MPGALYHAQRFAKRPYLGSDGLEHWEVEPVDGDVDVVSHSSWVELVDHCARLGVPRDVWPTFDCECAIDVPLDEVDARQAAFGERMRNLDPARVSSHELLSRLLIYLGRGERLFFTN